LRTYPSFTVYGSARPTVGVFGVGFRCRPWPPAPPGDCLWQTL